MLCRALFEHEENEVWLTDIVELCRLGLDILGLVQAKAINRAHEARGPFSKTWRAVSKLLLRDRVGLSGSQWAESGLLPV